MKPLATLALLALALTSCAATLAVHGTAPVTLNDGTCALPVESPAKLPMWVFASPEPLGSTIMAATLDSLLVNPGYPFAFRWSVTPGMYRVTAWARNAGGASCSTSVMVEAVSRPAPVKVTP